MSQVTVKKIKMPNGIVSSIMWLILGIILILEPGESLDMLCKMLGVVILVAGVVELIVGFVAGATITGRTNIGLGVVIALIGLFIIIMPGFIVSILPFVAGTFLLIHGITSLINAIQLIGNKDKYWWMGILLSSLTIVLGCILFFNAHKSAEFIARIAGLFMLYAGISRLWIAYRKSQSAKYRAQEDAALDVDAKIIDAE